MKKEVPCLDCRGQGLISKFNEKSAWLERCQNCGGTGVITVVVTNADRIRAMSDEELAKFLAEPCSCDVDPGCDGYRECGNDLCLKYLLKWLQQLAEEDT